MSAKKNDSPEIIIYPTRSKTLATVFGSLMFAVAAVFFLLTPDIYARLVGAGGLVACGASTVYAAYRLVSNAPVVVLNRTACSTKPRRSPWAGWTGRRSNGSRRGAPIWRGSSAWCPIMRVQCSPACRRTGAGSSACRPAH
ncbi:MAG: hypothetical protein ACPGQM_10640 [Alphaproteobacteria bacterium]